jgi:threonine dehydrogenase-like Zn-dependent dehydrogenase
MSNALQTMRAAVVVEPGRIEIEEVALPEPEANQVRVRLEGCGVCAPTCRRGKASPGSPIRLHLASWDTKVGAQSMPVGSDVQNFKVGDRVAMLSNNAYAEYDVADINSVVPLPQELEGQPFPGEPLGCAINIFKRSDIKAGQTVAIVGIGFLGALLTRFASDAGARVIAISRRPYSLEVARSMGAAETIAMDDHWQIIERVKELTGGVFCDIVIEAVGKQWPLDLAAELTRERGRLIVAGYHQDGPRQVNMQLWNWRGLDVINAHEREHQVYIDGISAAADAVANRVLDPTSAVHSSLRTGAVS